jgi:hypothetical protein
MSSSNTVRGSDAHNFSVVRSAELTARVAQDCQLNKADAKDLSAQSSTLTDAEALELSSLEAKVERSLKAFWEIGQALGQIRDRRLYRQDFSTFEDYCTNRWEMSRRWAYQLIEAATVYENVRHGAQILPANERQVRPLTALPSQEQPRAWDQAVSTAPNGKLTAFHVARVVEEHQKKISRNKSNNENSSKNQRTLWANHPSSNREISAATQENAGGLGATSSQTETQWRSCWNCYHCSFEPIQGNPQSFYCHKLGKLSFIEKDGNERGAECKLWLDRWIEPELVKKAKRAQRDTFTLTLQLPIDLQAQMQDAAKTQGLAVADWAAQVLKAAVSTISFASLVQPTHNITPTATSENHVLIPKSVQGRTSSGVDVAQKPEATAAT